MGTYRHKETGKRFLLVHIPRTGGRFISVNLEQNGWEMEPIDYYGIPHYQHSVIDDCEIAHFYRELYEKHCDIEGIPQIAVIRNPVDRFISASTYFRTLYGPQVQQRMEDYDEFISIIENFHNDLDVETRNWWRPQIDYLTDETYVWKFEDGLGDDFGNWMSEKLEVQFDIDSSARYRGNKHEDLKLDKTDKLVENIRKFVSEDIEKLDPEVK